MNNTITYLLCILLFGYCSTGYSQNRELLFENYNIKDGLSHSCVTAVLEDSKGYMWLGTSEGGLNKFNGYDFTVYKNKVEDSTSLPLNNVKCLLEDSNNRVWVGTNNGACYYNRESDNFTRIKVNSHYKSNIVNEIVGAIYEDSLSNLWIGSNFGLGLYRAHNNSITYYLLSDSINTYNVKSIFQYDAEHLLLGTTHGLILFNNDSYSVKPFPIEMDARNFDTPQYITGINKDNNGRIWISSLRLGLFMLDDYKNGILKHYLGHSKEHQEAGLNIIRVFTITKNNCFWIGTKSGLFHYNPHNGEYSNFRNDALKEGSLSQNSVYAIHEGSMGDLWVGTWNGGVNRGVSTAESFMHHKSDDNNKNGLNSNLINCFLAVEGGIWIGTQQGGLNFFNTREKKYFHYTHNSSKNNTLSHNDVSTLCMDSLNNIWVGTSINGFNYFNRQDKTFTPYLEGHRVTQLIDDINGKLWVCTDMGLFLYNKKEQSFRNFTPYGIDDNVLNYSSVSNMVKRQNGDILLLTNKYLWKYNTTSNDFEYCASWSNTSNSIIGKINSVYEDSKNQIWIGTYTGLYKLNEQSELIEEYNKVPRVENIKGILEDDSGNLWLSSGSGIYFLDLNSNTTRRFTYKDGLQSNEFTVRACAKDKEGKMYFGGINGYNVFHPDKINIELRKPKIVFTDLLIYNKKVGINDGVSPLTKHISETKEIILTAKQKVFTIKYVALDYSRNKDIEYAYILENYDKEWNKVGDNRSASYSNLRHGNYYFKVKTLHFGSSNDANITGIKLTILPPFWKTIWFKALVLLLTLSLIIWIYRLRIAGIKRRNEQLQSEVEIKTKEVELMSAEMQKANEAKLRFFTNISHELRTPLTLILGSIDEIRKRVQTTDKEGDEYLELLSRNSTRLLHLINQLIDFRRIEQDKMSLDLTEVNIVTFVENIQKAFQPLAIQQNIKYTFKSEIKQYFLKIDREKMEMIMFNLLSNAFKFTQPHSSIETCIEQAPDSGVFIHVKDTGMGIAPEQQEYIFERFMQVSSTEDKLQYGSGIGLALAKELIELQQGKISLKSEVGRGSTFTLFLKMGVEELNTEVNKEISEKAIDYSISSSNKKSLEIISEKLNLSGKVNKDGHGISLRKPERQTILIVDDNEDIRTLIANSLSGTYNTIEAVNGQEGLLKAEEVNVDIVISDVIMPNMDGLEFCKKLKSKLSTSHIPVILLTAYTSDNSQIKGLEMGADAYIPKPFKQEILLARIKNLLNSRKILHEKFSKNLVFKPKEISTTTTDEKFLNKLMNTLESNLSDPGFTIEILSETIGMSRSHLNRKMQNLLNMTTSDFIRAFRIKRAAQLIRETDLRVTEIIYDVGFASRAYFNESFKKQFSMTPTEYLKKYRHT